MTKVSKERRKVLLARKKKLEEKGGAFIFVKDGITLRFRALPVDPELEPGVEVIQFYLGQEFKGVISPRSIGEPCPIMEKYEKLKNSKDEDDKALAEKLKPSTKFVMAVIVKKDKLGKEVDEQRSPGLLQVAKGAYQTMIDYFLDPEHGDFTDPKEGYDLKISRTGTGKNDTKYTVLNCKESPLPKKYDKVWDAQELLKKEIKSYDELEEILGKFLNTAGGDDEDDDKPKKKKKRPVDEEAPKKKKKKVSKDLDDEDDDE